MDMDAVRDELDEGCRGERRTDRSRLTGAQWRHAVEEVRRGASPGRVGGHGDLHAGVRVADRTRRSRSRRAGAPAPGLLPAPGPGSRGAPSARPADRRRGNGRGLPAGRRPWGRGRLSGPGRAAGPSRCRPRRHRPPEVAQRRPRRRDRVPVEHPGHGHELRDGRGRHRGHHRSDAVSQQGGAHALEGAALPPRTSPPPAPWQWTSMKAGARISSSDRTIAPEASRRSARSSAGDGSISSAEIRPASACTTARCRRPPGSSMVPAMRTWLGRGVSPAVYGRRPSRRSTLARARCSGTLRGMTDTAVRHRYLPARRPADPRAILRLALAAEESGWDGISIWDSLGSVDGQRGRRPLRDAGGRRGAARQRLHASSPRSWPLPGGGRSSSSRPPRLLDRSATVGSSWAWAPARISADFTAFGDDLRPGHPDRAAWTRPSRSWTPACAASASTTPARSSVAQAASSWDPHRCSPPRPPIWLGAMKPGGIRRAARLDGWIVGGHERGGQRHEPDAGGPSPPEAIASTRRAEALGRAGEPFDVAVLGVSGAGTARAASPSRRLGPRGGWSRSRPMRGSVDELEALVRDGPPR